MRPVQCCLWPRARRSGCFPGAFPVVALAAAALVCAGCASTSGHHAVRAAASSAAAAVPALGQLAGVFAHGEGFGQVRPSKIFNGGDPTGLVSGIVWKSWGGSRAVGTGTSDYVGPSQSVATGTQETVTVVAFNLGTCHGKRMYRAVEWYFPQHGQTFDPGRYENICAGAYVPAA